MSNHQLFYKLFFLAPTKFTFLFERVTNISRRGLHSPDYERAARIELILEPHSPETSNLIEDSAWNLLTEDERADIMMFSLDLQRLKDEAFDMLREHVAFDSDLDKDEELGQMIFCMDLDEGVSQI